MSTTRPRFKVTDWHFRTLRERYGTHSEVARRLGIGPHHYCYVRRSGRMSNGLARAIQLLAEQTEPVE